MADLERWVEVFRRQHAKLLTAVGAGAQGRAGSYRRRYPWPDCWGNYPSLVTDLVQLRAWTVALEMDDLETAAVYGVRRL